MKWTLKDIAYFIVFLGLVIALTCTLLWGKDIDALGVISVVVGLISIILAIVAIIQSCNYNKSSNIILSEINKKQDKLYNVIDDLKSNIDTDSTLPDETKSAIKSTLDKVPDMYHSDASRPIQQKERKVIAQMLEEDLSKCIKKRDGSILTPEESFIDIQAVYQNTNLYFTYSIRNTVSGENWSNKNMEEFFSSRINTYISNKTHLEGLWIIIIVYSDSVYYYIANSETNPNIPKKISLGEDGVLMNKEWIEALMNDVDKFCNRLSKI